MDNFVTRLCGWQDYKFKWPVEAVLWAKMPLQRFMLLFECLLEETEEIQGANIIITTVMLAYKFIASWVQAGRHHIAILLMRFQ